MKVIGLVVDLLKNGSDNGSRVSVKWHTTDAAYCGTTQFTTVEELYTEIRKDVLHQLQATVNDNEGVSVGTDEIILLGLG